MRRGLASSNCAASTCSSPQARCCTGVLMMMPSHLLWQCWEHLWRRLPSCTCTCRRNTSTLHYNILKIVVINLTAEMILSVHYILLAHPHINSYKLMIIMIQKQLYWKSAILIEIACSQMVLCKLVVKCCCQ